VPDGRGADTRGAEVVGEYGDPGPALDLLEPPARRRVVTVLGAEEIAADGAGGVAAPSG
jgi:hypothetical protein